jgi:hypothetical protein
MKVGGNSRLKQVATDIASGQLDSDLESGASALLSEQGYSGIGGVPAITSVNRGGATYSIEREVQPGTSGCGVPSGGDPPELELTVYVTWAGGATGTWWTTSDTSKIVQESTIATLPMSSLTLGDGSILVKVTDDGGDGQNLVQVTLSNTSYGGTVNESAWTNPGGCALFMNLTTGPYTATPYKAGWIDSNIDTDASGNPVSPIWTGNVVANQTLSLPGGAPLYYAQETTVSESFSVPAGSSASLPTVAVNGGPGGPLVLPLTFYNGDLPSTYHVAATPAEVFPSSTPYTAVATSCNDANGLPDLSSTADGVSVPTSGTLSAGGSATANFQLTPVQVAVIGPNGAQLQGASVTASASTPTGGTDTNCGTGSLAMPTLSLGPTCPNGTSCSVQAAYHAGTSPQGILTAWTGILQRGTSRSVARSGKATPRQANTERSLRSRSQMSSSHVAAPSSRAPRSGDAKRPTSASAQRRMATKPIKSVQEPPAGASRDVTALVTGGATRTSLSSNVNRSVRGQPVTFVATVEALSGNGGTPTGTVTFKDGKLELHEGALDRGVASFTTSRFAVANHSISATYRGNGKFKSSTSTLLSQSVHQASTETTLTSSANADVHGQPVTFTATVVASSPSSATPRGVVTFLDGHTTLRVETLRKGAASYTTSSLPTGSSGHRLTAVYGGDASFGGSASVALSQHVHRAGTTTTVVSNSNPSVYGQPVTFTATVGAVSPGSGIPEGTVSFLDGGTLLHTSTLRRGAAAYTTSSLALTTSSHSIVAVYRGDANFAGSTSVVLPQQVHPAGTTTSLSSNAKPNANGQPVTLAATVAAASPGSGTPTGTVTFYDGTSVLFTGSLKNGGAGYTTSALALTPSSHVVAVYGGDTNFESSTSGVLSQAVPASLTRSYRHAHEGHLVRRGVNRDAVLAAWYGGVPYEGTAQLMATSTTTTVSSGTNPSVYGQTVTFTAHVTPTAATGTVTFYDGGTSIGTGTLSGGTATYTTTAFQLAVGSNSITAKYGGNGTYSSSTSSALTQTVNAASTTTAVSSGANPSVYGQTVTFTATVTATSPGSGTPTGTVTFYDGGTSIGTGTLSGGSATYTTTAFQLALGSNSITATYGATTNYATSTSSALTQTVNQASTTTAVSSSANPSVYGQAVTFTATVTATSPGSGTPTGTVTFYDGGTSIGTGTLSGGSATYTTTAFQLALGSNSITATYGATTNYKTSTSSALTQTVNQASTTTTVSSSANPSNYGQAVTFTATVTATSPGSGTPTGTVTFYDGGTSIGTGPLSGGSATYTTTVGQLAVGSNSITAQYATTTDYLTSTSSALTQTVNQTSTTTTVASGANPSVYGQTVTFTATVTATSPGAGTPTGTVTFYDGGTSIGTGSLSGGAATYTTTAFQLALGSNSITAQYGATTNYASSTSSALTQTVNQASTTTSVASGANPSVYGQTVTFTATVTATSPGSGTPTGTVTFYDAGTSIGTGTLSGGQATYTTTAFQLALGSNSITATYGGATDYTSSTSSALTQTVNQASTTTTVASGANPSVYGQTVTFTATVTATSPGSGTPTGTVTFKDGGTTLGTGTLSGGQATYTTTAFQLALGSNSITAAYGGATDYASSTSSALTQTVNQASTTTTVASGANPSVYGQTVTFTATVTATSPGSGTPTGTVTFYDNGTSIGTGTLSGGQATYTTTAPQLPAGSNSITATYGGATDYASSTSSALTQTVNKASTTTTVASSYNPSYYGQLLTLTATVADSTSGSTGTPTGTVTFYDNGASIGTGTLNTSSPPTATFTTFWLPLGTDSITAVYSGDSNFLTSTSGALSQVVNQANDFTLSSLPYGTYLVGATYKNAVQGDNYKSTNTTIVVVVQISSTWGVRVNYSVNSSVNWVQVSAGSEIVVPVS